MGFVKTTLDIPDAILRPAKSKAAEQGMSLRQFVADALAARLQSTSASRPKPWMKHFGKLKHLRKETRRISKIIEHASEKMGRPKDTYPTVSRRFH
jgi:hypothetical protein